MKIVLKSFAALLFFVLVVWAIRSDSQQDRGDVVAAAVLPRAATPPAGDASWRLAPLWDDGKAEFCAYEATWPRYGHRFEGRALMVLVKEPWAPDLNVKADRPRPDGFEVLKLNHVRDVATGIYTYHQMASVYTHRGSGALEKIAATSSEACGVTTSEVVAGRLSTHSYFDGQGDRSLPYPAGALPEDGLPASLRDYVAGPLPATLDVFPSLMASKLPKLEPATWRVERRDAGEVDTPEGGVPGVEVRLVNGKSFLAYTFEQQAPHRLLRFESGDGTVYRLAKCERIPYWQLHNPGDEAWLPERVR